MIHGHNGSKPVGKWKVGDHGAGYRRRGNILEHRYLMEKRIGRALKPLERVHHWDEDRKNNQPPNLALLRHEAAHQRIHAFARRHGMKVMEVRFKQPWL